MNPLHPLFAITVFVIAFITGYVIKLGYKQSETIARYQTIDGLRGFLALSVFIHHSVVWYQFIQTGGLWDAPKSNLYNQFGKVGVTLFFMITSFLFVSKLLNTNEKVFNWNNFFRSRVVRLVPMYYFSVLLIFLIVMYLSHWKLNVGVPEFLHAIFNWGTFLIYGECGINNSVFSATINAGVVWSLSFEWLFYISLPLVGLIILKTKPPKIYLLFSIVFVLLFFHTRGIEWNIINSFLGGAIAPVLLKYTSLKNKAD